MPSKDKLQELIDELIGEQNAIAGGSISVTGGSVNNKNILWQNEEINNKEQDLKEANTLSGMFGFPGLGGGEGMSDINISDTDEQRPEKKKNDKKKDYAIAMMWAGDESCPINLKIKYSLLEHFYDGREFLDKKIIKIKCNKNLNLNSIELIKDFLKFVQKKLSIEEFPVINLHSKKKEGMTTGSYDMNKNEIHCLVGHRLIIDMLRTLAHELCHRRQHETGILETELKKQDPMNEMGDLNTVYENEAYEKAGNFVKEFCRIQKRFDKDELYELYENIDEAFEEQNTLGSGNVLGYILPLGMKPNYNIMWGGKKKKKEKRNLKNKIQKIN